MAAVPEPMSRYWSVPIGRALVALVAAVIITFAANHSALLGLVVFGGFAILSGLVVGVLSWRALQRSVLRTLFAVSAVVSVVLGIVALVLHDGGLGWFLALVSAWAAITGFIELYAGLKVRRRQAISRDWLTIGGLTALLAIVFLLVPPDIVQHFRGPDKVDRSLTSSVILVGAFGAYCAIVCVYQAIGGLSLRWGTEKQHDAHHNDAHHEQIEGRA